MRSPSSASFRKRTRVLFLAWGYSIHAERRIQIFVDDPSFEVAVVSNYDYGFEGAANFLLKGVRRKESLCTRISQAAAALKFLVTSTVLLKQESFWPRSIGQKLIRQLRDFVSLRRLLGGIVRAAEDLKTLKAAVIKFNPDVLFLQTLLYPCYLAYYLPRSIPLMVTFWNGDLTWWAQWDGIEKIFKKSVVRYGICRAHAITVNSNTAYEACLAFGVRKGKIFLVRYPGVELERFKPLERYRARKDIGIVNEKVVLCPRGLGGYFNSDVIIEAVREVISRFPDTLFLFLARNGNEKQWEAHLERAHSLGIARNIRCDCKVPWEVMPTYYNASDVMISISSYDSLPNCLLEAMACELPVIMSDLPQIREWVTDGINGFTVSPRNPEALSNKIINVLEGGGEQARIFGKYNLKLVTDFADSKKNVERIKNLVHGVTKPG
jgi:glycosyltransferase involved in cell wall biosynthesis